ncbi:MAG: helix-turn-helix domain-containing protein [Bacilli bacterium]|nr:helix-turn-helix domain-containing protein [Bacilli bacterium]
MEKIRDNEIANYIRMKRKEFSLTQKEFAFRSGLGLRFVRDLEQGKQTLRMDKVNQALALFDATLTIKKKPKKDIEI